MLALYSPGKEWRECTGNLKRENSSKNNNDEDLKRTMLRHP